MKSIIYKDADGHVVIVNPVYKHFKGQGIAESAMLEILKDRHVPEGATDVHIIDTADIPEDRHFRDALDIVDGRLIHNLDKARDVQLSQIRVQRNKKLKELDLQKLIAKEHGNVDKVNMIVNHKQVLRDIPQHLNLHLIDDLEELKGVTHPLLEDK